MGRELITSALMPLIVYDGFLPFPGNERPSLLPWREALSKLKLKKTAREVWDHYFYVNARVIFAVKAEHLDRTVFQGGRLLPFYADAVLVEIQEITDIEKGRFVMEINTKGLTHCKVLAIRDPQMHNYPFHIATDFLLTPESDISNEFVDTEVLSQCETTLESFLKHYRSQIKDKATQEKITILTNAIHVFLDPAEKERNRELEVRSARVLYRKLRDFVYYFSSHFLCSFVNLAVIQKILVSPFLQDEIQCFTNALRSALGEEDSDENTAQTEEVRYQARFEETRALMSLPAQRKIREALSYIKRTAMSAERSQEARWVERALSLPWGKNAPGIGDFPQIIKALEKNHYGMDKPKKRILEFIAAHRQNPNARGQILCFVGPPGTGKTSLARAIAYAIGRPFIHRSLGGITDEVEIRGHRRTYIGAYSGDIINSIIHAKVNNPVFLLDEVDKIANAFRGDPSAALMEALDPEQNREFQDRYLDFPYDLSRVMFICTANEWEQIPAPLRDRMEKISIPGYFEYEKVTIAKYHLIPRQLEDKGLKGRVMLIIPDDILHYMIVAYTFEPGVRKLEELISRICSNLTYQIQTGKKVPKNFVVTLENIKTFLGKPPLDLEKSHETLPGEVLGLAVVGKDRGSFGELLSIQCRIIKGRKRKHIYTGSMKGVMRDSAKNALSALQTLGLPSPEKISETLENNHMHISTSDGAQAKDGPSAGIAFCIAIISAIWEKPLRPHIAMTGEIDIFGRIHVVGSIKEKLLGAERSGVREVIVPKKNMEEIQELPSSIRDKIQIIPVATINEVIQIVFPN